MLYAKIIFKVKYSKEEYLSQKIDQINSAAIFVLKQSRLETAKKSMTFQN